MKSTATVVAVSVLLVAGIAGAEVKDAGVVEAIATGDGVSFRVSLEHAGGTLKVAGPDGTSTRMDFAAAETPSFAPEGGLADGHYRYELTLAPRLSAAERAALQEARRRGEVPESLRTGRVLSGSFALAGGTLVADQAEAEGGNGPVVRGTPVANGVLAAETQVIAMDLIVQGSECVGVDCTASESFGFDTIRLKENNLRIKFDDTSNSGSFPNVDWQLTANDSSNGGANKFSIDDITNGRTPFTIEAAAPSNSLFVDDGGRVGLGTATPVVELHVVDGDSPAMRLEQDGSSGFTPQTWDVAGNEANFFVRDVTNGSKLPFKIVPNAPTNSLYVAADGDVGLGTASPAERLDVKGDVLVTASGTGQALEVVGGDVKVGRTAGGNTSFFIENTGGTLPSSWILRANGTTGGFTFTESGGVSPFRINTGALSQALTLTSTGVDVQGTLRVGGITMNVPDYVFDASYALLPIPDQGRFMSENRHLPAVPAEQLGDDGRPRIDLIATQMGMLEELEKAHLYIQQLHGELEQLRAEVTALRASRPE